MTEVFDKEVFGEPITSPDVMRKLRCETALSNCKYLGLDLSDAEKAVLKKMFDGMSDVDVFAWMKRADD